MTVTTYSIFAHETQIKIRMETIKKITSISWVAPDRMQRNRLDLERRFGSNGVTRIFSLQKKHTAPAKNLAAEKFISFQ